MEISDYGFPTFRCTRRPVTSEEGCARPSKMTGRINLRDANVLVALATPDHSLNARAAAWFRKGHRFVPCPITQGAVFRFHLRVVSTPRPPPPRPSSMESPPCRATSSGPMMLPTWISPTTGLVGYRQVTDAYLVLLARRHDGALATMDVARAT
ncbi:MAG: VapC toxin family PIN domain ribonuclease [Bryobacterales bacterium]|nr:VapC toxin family PIN domain ribonuclease [Bryobacterales bacterium]